MKLGTLKKALEHYLYTADCDKEEVVEALTECAQLEERFDDYEALEGNSCILSINSVLQLLNLTTYDIYGKMKKAGRCTSLNHYAHEVRLKLGLDMTLDTLSIGYSFVKDLWHDNEEIGANNEDGTFRR